MGHLNALANQQEVMTEQCSAPKASSVSDMLALQRSAVMPLCLLHILGMEMPIVWSRLSNMQQRMLWGQPWLPMMEVHSWH